MGLTTTTRQFDRSRYHFASSYVAHNSRNLNLTSSTYYASRLNTVINGRTHARDVRSLCIPGLHRPTGGGSDIKNSAKCHNAVPSDTRAPCRSYETSENDYLDYGHFGTIREYSESATANFSAYKLHECAVHNKYQCTAIIEYPGRVYSRTRISSNSLEYIHIQSSVHQCGIRAAICRINNRQYNA